MPKPPGRRERPCVFHAVHGNDERHVYAVGLAGSMYRSINGKRFETGRHFGRDAELVAVHAGKGSVVWVVAKRVEQQAFVTRLKYSSDAGLHFSDVPLPRKTGLISAIGGSSAGELVVAQEGHVFERMSETGDWIELTNGAFVASGPIVALAVPAPRHVIAMGWSGRVVQVWPVDSSPPEAASDSNRSGGI